MNMERLRQMLDEANKGVAAWLCPLSLPCPECGGALLRDWEKHPGSIYCQPCGLRFDATSQPCGLETYLTPNSDCPRREPLPKNQPPHKPE